MAETVDAHAADQEGAAGKCRRCRRCTLPCRHHRLKRRSPGVSPHTNLLLHITEAMAAAVALAAGHTDSVLACTVLPGPKLLASGGEASDTMFSRSTSCMQAALALLCRCRRRRNASCPAPALAPTRSC